jgi:hypothetical protein
MNAQLSRAARQYDASAIGVELRLGASRVDRSVQVRAALNALDGKHLTAVWTRKCKELEQHLVARAEL